MRSTESSTSRSRRATSFSASPYRSSFMRMTRILTLAAMLASVVAAVPAEAQQYAARQKGDIVQLEDQKNQTTVSIITSVGMIAYEMSVKGQNILRGPNSIDEFRAKPIHGFMTRTNQWQVVEAKADGKAAWVSARLDTYKQPDWMKQWPFAHTIDVTYRLQDGTLEVLTKVTNHAVEPMPVSLGWHPYYQLTDSPREEWTVEIPARTWWRLDYRKVPTGATEPVEKIFPGGKGALKDYNLDDVFSDLTRDAQGRATVVLKGRKQQLEISQGPNYKSLVIYSPNPLNTGLGSQIAPPNPNPPAAPAAPAVRGAGGGLGTGPANSPNFICFEPMAGITNALNLAHKGTYRELQYIKPGGTWQESFWIKPSGF